jgi:hypothetical protein
MQLFWVSPFILFPLYFLGRKFSWTLVLIILLSMGCTFTVAYLNEFRAYPLLMGEKEALYNQLIYSATHARMGTWFIGCGLGYILFKHKNIRLNPVIVNSLFFIFI